MSNIVNEPGSILLSVNEKLASETAINTFINVAAGFIKDKLDADDAQIDDMLIAIKDDGINFDYISAMDVKSAWDNLITPHQI